MKKQWIKDLLAMAVLAGMFFLAYMIYIMTN